MNSIPPEQPQRWFHEAMVWLLIVIPAIALVAGLVTLILAYRNADPEVPRAEPGVSQQVR